MKILVVRLGAWGDSIVITPFLRFLKRQGHTIVLHTSEIGMKVLKENSNIDQFVPYVANSVPDDKLVEHWNMLKNNLGCDKLINLCESLERAISLHPIDPAYNLSKDERRARCDKNFYEHTFTYAGVEQNTHIESFLPELFFSEEEETSMRKWFEQFRNRFVIVWGLSGSALHKAYPYTDYVMAELLRDHPDIVFITTGDELCQALEHKDKRVVNRSGIWSMREAALACKYADLVVAPDTGLLHAAGCYVTPKIGLVGSNTLNNLTKHFVNDFSLQADEHLAPCSPCFRLIYKASTQCPVDRLSLIPVCMSKGIRPDLVKEKIETVKSKFGVKSEHSGNAIQMQNL